LLEAEGLPEPTRIYSSPKKTTCVVLLRHGQREDYVALEKGDGEEWVLRSERPWDPSLAAAGHKQVQAAAVRLRKLLEAEGLPEPTRIYSSPLARCIQSGQIMADEFSVSSVLVEEGLSEAACEAWFRQWAVANANGCWGGPPGSSMTEEAMHTYLTTVQGPESAGGVRCEAIMGISTLIRTPKELARDKKFRCAKSKVDPMHKSCIELREHGYRWGKFELKPEVRNRVTETIRTRASEYPGQTLVFVSHGGPTMYAFEELSGQKIPKGSGGMASMSLLKRSGRARKWDVTLANDAKHSLPFREGVE